MKEAQEYSAGNSWQRNRYAFMSRFNLEAGITDFGTSLQGDKPYHHLITQKDSLHNFLYDSEIRKAVFERFEKKAGDLHRALTNTVASQPCCFNLFVPLQKDLGLASKLFTKLMGKDIAVKHIDIEFTPNVGAVDLSGFEKPDDNDESLRDQTQFAGTDADVAVFYTFDYGQKGVLLIELKYIEAEFSVCSSYRTKKDIRTTCDHQGYYQSLIADTLEKTVDSPLCGYLKYNNWQLLNKSGVFLVDAIKSANHCPFRFSLQQLWRNMLLAENVTRSRNLDEFGFWVVSPKENIYLWEQKDNTNVETEFRKILTELGNKRFERKELKKDLVDNLKEMVQTDYQKDWIRKFEERYLTGTE